MLRKTLQDPSMCVPAEGADREEKAGAEPSDWQGVVAEEGAGALGSWWPELRRAEGTRGRFGGAGEVQS